MWIFIVFLFQSRIKMANQQTNYPPHGHIIQTLSVAHRPNEAENWFCVGASQTTSSLSGCQIPYQPISRCVRFQILPSIRWVERLWMFNVSFHQPPTELLPTARHMFCGLRRAVWKLFLLSQFNSSERDIRDFNSADCSLIYMEKQVWQP